MSTPATDGLYNLAATQFIAPDGGEGPLLDKANISRRAFQNYASREVGIVFPPKRIGAHFFYPAFTADVLKLIKERKGANYSALRHEVWAIAGLPISRWELWRLDRIAELEEYAGKLAMVRMLIALGASLESLARKLYKRAETKQDARARSSVIDRRRLRSEADRSALFTETLRSSVLMKTPTPGQMTPTGRSLGAMWTAAVAVPGHEPWAQNGPFLSDDSMNPRALIDAMRKTDEPTATAVRDFIKTVILPMATAEFRDVFVRDLTADPMLYASMMAALLVQGDDFLATLTAIPEDGR
jgi:hypothetical protein